MKNEDIILTQLLNDMNADMLNDLKALLKEETSKPGSKWDIDRITELSSAIAELSGAESANAEQIETVKRKYAESAGKKKTICCRITSVAACLAVVLLLNQWSLSALGMNGFKAAYYYTIGSMKVSNDVANNEPSDPYGIKEKCAEYGIEYPIPTYIPEGFELVETVEGNHRIGFNFEMDDSSKNEAILPRIYFSYINNYQDNNIEIPSDNMNFEERNINGEVFLVGTDDNQIRVIWSDDNFLFHMTTHYLDCETVKKILMSMKGDIYD